MSKADRIEELEAENERLRTENQELRQRVLVLEGESRQQHILGNAIGQGADTTIKSIVAQYEDLIQEKERRVENLTLIFRENKRLLDTLLPSEMLDTPIAITEENRAKLAEYAIQNIATPSKLMPTFMSWQHDCLVSMTALVRTGAGAENVFFHRWGPVEFPGSFDEFKREVDWRVNALMWAYVRRLERKGNTRDRRTITLSGNILALYI